MEVVVEFTESAFRHGLSEADIRHALKIFHAMKLRESFKKQLGL
jgi:hypothetical protein